MRTLRTLLLLLAVTALGCAQGVIKTEKVSDLTETVVSRHDRYVESDTEISPIKRNDLLILSFNVREKLKKSEVKAADLGFFLWPLIKRHDAYIEKDKKLKKVLKRTRLRSSELLRRILLEAGYQGG